MRDAFDHARDAGVNLAFLGADIGNWQIRFSDRDRTIIEYRDARRRLVSVSLRDARRR